MEQNNLELMQRIVEDHQASLRAAYTPRHRNSADRKPGRVRMACGRILIQLGERLRGAQSAPAETQPVRLAMGK